MKTLRSVLREADPLTYERADPERMQRQRRAVLALPRGEAVEQKRPYGLVAAVIVALVALAASAGYWAGTNAKAASVRFAVQLAEDHPGSGLQPAGERASGRPIYIQPGSVVTNSDVAEAHVIPGSSPTTFGIAITLTSTGASKMQGASRNHIGRPMAIIIDGEVVMAPIVRATMTTEALVTGDFSRAEAERVVAGIIGR